MTCRLRPATARINVDRVNASVRDDAGRGRRAPALLGRGRPPPRRQAGDRLRLRQPRAARAPSRQRAPQLAVRPRRGGAARGGGPPARPPPRPPRRPGGGGGPPPPPRGGPLSPPPPPPARPGAPGRSTAGPP